jgi:6-phosphofructokinase 1
VPERVFDEEKFLADVKAVNDRLGRCLVAVSEGIVNAAGEPIVTTLIKEMEACGFGHVPMSGTGALGDMLMDRVKSGLKINRVRSDTFGYIQRSFLSCVSDRDAREAREAGEKAVQFAMWDDVDGSVAIKRPVLSYSVDYELVDLEKVAGKTKYMADEFINAEGNGVTQAYYDYVRPLVGSGLAEAHRLRAPEVKPG